MGEVEGGASMKQFCFLRPLYDAVFVALAILPS